MLRPGCSIVRHLLLAAPLAWTWMATSSHAYVDLAPTLAKIVSDSTRIAVVEVVEFDRAKRELVLKEVRALKGEMAAEPVRHEVAAVGAAIPRLILQWVAPGARGVLFASRNTALVCAGQGWYQVRTSGDGAWKLGKDRPDLPLAYYGNVSRLSESITLMLSGRDAVLTVVAHGADNEGASFDLALNRPSVPGLVRVQRIRANLTMPPMVMAASANAAYLIGPGAVGEEEVASLVEKLKSPDALVRAEAAGDLRCLGSKAAAAAGPLARMLDGSSPRVRLSAAAALLQIDPKNARAVEVLAIGLESSDLATRRDAAKAAGLAGSGAAPLAEKLANLVKDSDESMRITAIQAIAMLGPDAAKAAGAVTTALDDPEVAIDAADALGRIGSAARPALARLAKMLSADQPAVRWAAVRAMSQIGGEGAKPAVDFIIRALGNATEVEGYNMMIYLALLGPVAKDAAPTIQRTRIKNPVLPSATLWAIESDKTLPWLGGGRFGMGFPGGPGGQGPDFAMLIYQAYVRELGDRLVPAARLLAGKIMDGTAGEVPAWGYEILACGRDEVVGMLAPRLADKDLAMRQRAAVALGNMGPAAAPAAEQVRAALNQASTDREKRLLAWCLKKITGE
ncbi:MAG: HEAT repeat domain-containing protein [Pirellulales bacterium]